MSRDRILPVDPLRPEPDVIQAAGEAIAGGKVVVFPTRCLYGLGADAVKQVAVEQVFALKQRPKNNPVLVLVRRVRHVHRLAAEVSESARKLMDNLWPGGVTLVFRASPDVLPILTAGSGRIGIRLPGHPVAAALVEAAGRPITGTSANIAGEPGAARIGDLSPKIAAGVDLVLDAGPLEGGAGSTVVDVSGALPRVLRLGAVSVKELEQATGVSLT